MKEKPHPFLITEEVLVDDLSHTNDWTNDWYIKYNTFPQENKMSQTYYEYVILLSPADEDEPTEIIQELKAVVAKDEATVRLQAAREIPDSFEDVLDEVEILVRPFV